MPRGREKMQSSDAPSRREGYEKSSPLKDAPKMKNVENVAVDLGGSSPMASPDKSHLESKITNYFSPRRLLQPIPMSQTAPCPAYAPKDDASGDSDQALDRSQGDSGKENEENAITLLKSQGIRGSRALGARPKSTSTKTNVLTQSAESYNCSPSSLNKMPLTLSSSAAFCLPSEPSVTPTTSPTKSNLLPTSSTKSPVATLTSLISNSEKGPAVLKLQELKPLVPTKPETTTSEQPVKEPKRRQQPAKNLSASCSVGGRQDKLSKAASGSHKVTEYFPVRRSERRSKTSISKEPLADVEHHLLANSDAQLDIAVEHFPEKGRGVVASRQFVQGEFVVEYAGDLIDVDIAKERESNYSLDLSKGCYMYYFKHKGKQYCIDATEESGRVGRLINHSRLHPNLQTKVVTFKNRLHLILVARRDINQGAELLYDYGDRSKESLLAHPWLAL